MFASLIGGAGELGDYKRFPYLKFNPKSANQEHQDSRSGDIAAMKEFISRRKPHVIVIGVVDR